MENRKKSATPTSLPTKDRSFKLNERWMAFGICLFLGFIVWTVFGQTLGFDFVNYDDGKYVYENPHVIAGLTWEGVRWAATYGEIGHWHPLTWISHMLDCQLYGLWPGGHHLTNVLIHGTTAISMFLLLRAMTGSLWQSAFLAAAWAVHPLRVESVAWVAERKDVLSGFFFVLTLAAYVRYARWSESFKSENNASLSGIEIHPHYLPCLLNARYGLVFILFALGLLAKNMLVTLPCLLLLLDYWPLRRTGAIRISHLLIEKLPLFALSAISCIITFLVPEHLDSTERLPLLLRVENIIVTYVVYIRQTFWPVNLAIPYPNPQHLFPLWTVIGSIALLTPLSIAAVIFRKTWPAFFVGWFWFIGMLIPVIGWVQISNYAHADRYTYLPQIGLLISLIWIAPDSQARERINSVFPPWVFGMLALLVIGGLITGAKVQASYWQGSESLWAHSITQTENNAVAHNNLGITFFQKGQIAEAIIEYRQALKIKPDYVEALCNLGGTLLQNGQLDEAITQCQRALEIKSDYPQALCDLGGAFLQKGKVDQAIIQYQRALQIYPNYAAAYCSLGAAFLQKGKTDEAITSYQRALQIHPEYPLALSNLASALLQEGRSDEAIEASEKALKIKPDYADALYNLGNALLQKG